MWAHSYMLKWENILTFIKLLLELQSYYMKPKIFPFYLLAAVGTLCGITRA
jgi:hypothetical protein